MQSHSRALTRGITIALFALVAEFADAQPADFLVARGRAGPLRTAMVVDTVYRRVPRENVSLIDLFREGMFTPALAIRFAIHDTSPALVAPIREWPCGAFSIQGIEVRDARFRTREGIGVGSTLRELRRAYPDARLSEEEGPHAWVESQQINFRLAGRATRDTVRVANIWLPGEDPRVVRRRDCPERGPLP